MMIQNQKMLGFHGIFKIHSAILVEFELTCLNSHFRNDAYDSVHWDVSFSCTNERMKEVPYSMATGN